MNILLAQPRGFCAGVIRAIRAVEEALEEHGAPVYVLNPIVHNTCVISELEQKGAVFVRALDEVPAGRPLLFSAHGVAPDRWDEAAARGLHVIDATCPLVEKVHEEARHYARLGYTILLIGRAGHDEIEGTRGWGGEDIRVVFSVEEIEALEVPDPDRVAYLTQTTLSMRECADLVEAVHARFPNAQGPCGQDICYATQNRQEAVITLAGKADLLLVVGDASSANSRRLAEIARDAGLDSRLVASHEDLDDGWFDGVDTVLISSGASVPERLVQGVVERLRQRHDVDLVAEVRVRDENVVFRQPEAVLAAARTT